MTAPLLRRLSRDRAAAPVRIAHLGTGNFFRAHAAWYTEHSPDAADWGIAAFPGRLSEGSRVSSVEARAPTRAEPRSAREPAWVALADQDGLYTLVVRAADGDRPETISSLTTVAGDLEHWRATFALPALAVVTTTVTEAGYRRAPDGGLDLDDPAVAADVAALREHGVDATVTTAPGALALGLAVRRAHDLPGVAMVPCDNVPDNGAMARRVVGDLAAAADPDLAAWSDEHVSFVTTMVDRITPATSDGDPLTVVTEPFSEWVLSGEFPAGRPRWEDAGARFVDDTRPWERRKLWLLNGSHSLMAYAGTIRGHETVADAIADPVVRGWVEDWWDAAAPHLPLPPEEIAAYRAALLERYANPRIRHLLTQIAADGSQKVPIRILPATRAALARGTVPEGAARALAAWVCHLRGLGAPVKDVAADALTALAAGDLDEAVERVLARLDADDPRLRAAVVAHAQDLGDVPGN